MLKKSMEELNRLDADAFRQAEKSGIVVVLDNVRSMHNVGSVFRTSDAFRVEKILLCGYTPKPPHRDIHKTALGATETVEWEAKEDAVKAIEELKEMGYRIFAVEQVHNSITLSNMPIQKKEKVAVVFGNEAEGVSESVIAACHNSLEIPQFGSKHSFNISVAAGIVLWELHKQLST